MLLKICTDATSAGVVIVVSGEIDISNVDDLKTAILLSLAAGIRDLGFDLAGVTFIDSVGLGALASGSDYVRERIGTYRIVRASPDLLRLFRLTGLDRVFAIQPQLADPQSGGAA